jgi:hypothetical protein
MIEIWEQIKEWEGYYISNKGNVKNPKGNLVALCVNKKRGYVYVFHSKSEMRPRALSVHRLVARYFILNPTNKPQVNHIDNVRHNNTLANLEWCTAKENIDHCIKQGRKVQLRGDQCPHSVLTEEIVRNIKKDIGTTTLKKIAEKYNTNYSNVAHIKRGSRWAHVS